MGGCLWERAKVEGGWGVGSLSFRVLWGKRVGDGFYCCWYCSGEDCQYDFIYYVTVSSINVITVAKRRRRKRSNAS